MSRVAAAMLFPLLLAGGHASAQSSIRTVQLTAGIHLITAEVAADDPMRTRGLMFREALAPNHGMLFVFDGKEVRCMWMRNTLVPLSVAFIEDDGRIVNIEDMAPQTDDSHCASAPVRYALEMQRGWFAQRGLKAGATINGIAGKK
ncbi:MAG TPA: DUF192 domain-containing protein [Burkholderiaceae bacterium]|nr:DUF192 domain-containing protein [Burkholderiaceae bacterium]